MRGRSHSRYDDCEAIILRTVGISIPKSMTSFNTEQLFCPAGKRAVLNAHEGQSHGKSVSMASACSSIHDGKPSAVVPLCADAGILLAKLHSRTIVETGKTAERPIECELQLSGLPDAGLQPYVFDAERFLLLISHCLDPPDEVAAPQDRQGIIAIFPFAGRRVDLP